MICLTKEPKRDITSLQNYITQKIYFCFFIYILNKTILHHHQQQQTNQFYTTTDVLAAHTR